MKGRSLFTAAAAREIAKGGSPAGHAALDDSPIDLRGCSSFTFAIGLFEHEIEAAKDHFDGWPEPAQRRCRVELAEWAARNPDREAVCVATSIVGNEATLLLYHRSKALPAATESVAGNATPPSASEGPARPLQMCPTCEH